MRFPKFQNPISLGKGLVDAYQNRPKPSETSSLGKGLSTLDELIERYGQFMPYGAQVRAPMYFRGARVRSDPGDRQFAPERGTAEWPVQGVHFAESPKTAEHFGGSRYLSGTHRIFARKLDTRKTFDWSDPVPPRVAKNVAAQIREIANNRKIDTHTRHLLNSFAREAEKTAGQKKAMVLRENLVSALGYARKQDPKMNYQYDRDNPVTRELGTRFRRAFTKSGYDSLSYSEPIGNSGELWERNPAIAILKKPNQKILPIGGKRLQSALVRDRAERARRRMQDER